MFRSNREKLTLFLVCLCHGFWLFFTYNAFWMNGVITIFALAILIAFHSSLQHEMMHGHPFKSQKINDLLVFIPIGVFIPYERFRDTHLMHHKDSKLTDPYDDPETNYLDPEVWEKYGRFKKGILSINNTLLGRMIFGPGISLYGFYRSDLKACLNGDASIVKAWLSHAFGLCLLVGILVGFDVPILTYLLACYLGMSLLKIRTFIEHQAHERMLGRTVIIQDRGFFTLLFLNNNYHSVHHAHPDLPWYELPQKYEANEKSYLKRNCNYYYRNYFEVFTRYALKRKDDVAHPIYQKPKREREN